MKPVCKECSVPLSKNSRDKYGLYCRFHFLERRKKYRLKLDQRERDKYPVMQTAWGPLIVCKKRTPDREEA